MGQLENKKRKLNNVVVAIEPIPERSHSFDYFTETICRFQKFNVFSSTSVVSIIHSALYVLPKSWYYERESKLASEAKALVGKHCRDRFSFDSIKILKGKATNNSSLVEEASVYLKKISSSLLVVLSSDRAGVPYWVLGSFAETAAFTSSNSVLVVKPQGRSLEYSSKPRFTIALDSSVEYSKQQIDWIVDLAMPSKAQVDLVSVNPKLSGMFSSIKKLEHQKLPDIELNRVKDYLFRVGIFATLHILKEEGSVAETVVKFADKRKSWGIIAISTERKLIRKFLLGSVARKILIFTKRPFFAVRVK